ncbi:CBS domain-containing protein [Parvularcula sp. ZS-1/3]|uniref:CBS domain-containing protein n=1 Tax=Parvularcula mediterranea TaxID=2732508 RepID=A0A7Y3RJX2_9PROT|nr:CBS domain-containing protein [Parvularcula mediterranea]NNU15452.1 CBS domain-containing protein [Parvularcula mediterranea]
MHASDIIKAKGPKVETIDSGASLGNAIDRLAELKIGALLVTNGSQPVGIISERDVIRVLAGAPTGARETRVAEVMTADLITCTPEDGVDELLDLMTEKRIRHLPVMAGGELKGLLSIGDVVKHRIREVAEEAEALKSYITHG